MRKSKTTTFYDLIRYLLILSGTVITFYFLWTKIHPVLAILAAIPVYIVMLNLFGFLTLPLYFFTPESKAASRALKAAEEGDTSISSRIIEAYEKGEKIEDFIGNETTQQDNRG
jgi:hypothetical protein